jgi:hypothetical protein
VKFVPVIVTVVPVAAEVGVNEVIVGPPMKVNPASVPVPPGVVTETLPLPPEFTTAVIVVDETNANDEAGTPPKSTAVTPVKLVPVMVMVAPLPEEVGVNDVIVGAGM